MTRPDAVGGEMVANKRTVELAGAKRNGSNGGRHGYSPETVIRRSEADSWPAPGA